MRGLRGGALRRPVSLIPGRAISGSVLLPDRRTPAAGALVRFEGSTTSTRWTEARRDGSFLVDGVPAESGALVADGGDRGRASVPAPEGGAKATLVLAPTAGVRGRVVDATTTAPVSGIRVVARCGSATLTGRSGADGRYEVRSLPPGACRLAADDPRYVPWTGRVIVSAGESESKDVPLVRAATLAGRVVDPDGRPVEGATGQVFRGRENTMRSFFRFDSAFRSARDGTFKATRLAPGTNFRLTVRHEDFEARTLGGIELVAGATKSGLTVVLSRGLTVHGLVKDEAGSPLAGAEVELVRARMFQGGRRGDAAQFTVMGLGGAPPKKTTGADGRFEFRGLSAGDYTLVASKKGLTRERVDPLKVADGPEGEPVQLVLRAGVAIAGFVRDKSGNGAAGWMVNARPAGGGGGPFGGMLGAPPEPTGPDGSFLVEGLTAGESYDLQAFGAGGIGPRKSAVVAPADVELQVSGKGRIRGTAVDGETARPITDFEVSYLPAGGGGMMFRFAGPGARGRGPGEPTAVHAEDGSFELDDVGPGKWDVEVGAAGFQKGRVAGVGVEEGATTEGVEVRLLRGATLSGRVVEDRSGKPVLEATVRAEPASGGGRFRMGGPDDDGPTTTDAEGKFQIEGLAPGSYTLTATHTDWTEETERVEVKEQPVSVEIRLGKGGAIGGAVLAGGRGVPGATVSLSVAGGQTFRGPFGGGGQTAVTDEGGRFRFDTLSAGRYTLIGSLRSQSSSPVEAVLQAGESSQEVSLVLGEGATIRGAVTGLAESARANVMVSASGPEEYFANGRTGVDGTFEFTGAPKGPISLRASTGDFTGGSRSATAQVVIAEGQLEAAVEIVFEAGFRVEGQVTRGGRPVTDAFVIAMLEGGGGRQSSDRTDDTGAYRLEGLQEGTYSLVASSMGGGGSIRKTVKVTGDTTVDLEAPPAKIAGRIVEVESGRPLGEAVVRVEQGGSGGFSMMMASDSDSSGRFVVENLEPRSYRVSVTRPGYQSETREITASEDSEVTIELRRGEGVGLVVRDGIFGTPLRAVLVRVLDASGASLFTGSVTLDSDGRGEIPSLKSGRYEARIGADGYASMVLPAVAVPAPPITVALTPGGTLEIQSGPQTLARPGASGRLLDSGGSVYYPFVFSPDGIVRLTGPVRRLDNVAPGHYTFAVEGGPRREFDLREGGTAVVSLP